MGVDAAELRRTEDANSPLVFNFGVPASGPMMQQVVRAPPARSGCASLSGIRGSDADVAGSARRLCVGGAPGSIRPGWMRRRGRPACFATTVTRTKSLRHWTFARLLPVSRHQAELREAFQLDGAWADPTPSLDAYGWHSGSVVSDTQQRAVLIRSNLGMYDKALNDIEPGPAPQTALRDLLTLCHRKEIPLVLVMPPEKAPRSAAPIRSRLPAGLMKWSGV